MLKATDILSLGENKKDSIGVRPMKLLGYFSSHSSPAAHQELSKERKSSVFRQAGRVDMLPAPGHNSGPAQNAA